MPTKKGVPRDILEVAMMVDGRDEDLPFCCLMALSELDLT